MSDGKITLNKPRSVLDQFSFKMERPLMNPGKEYTDDTISFDYNAKIFFIKQDEKGRYFYGLSREYIPTENFYFLDDPGQ